MRHWCMPDAISVAFGQVVHRLREEKGLSQEQLALAAGVDRSFVSRVELGKVRLGLGIAKKLADALCVSLGALLAESEMVLDQDEH